MVDLKCQVGSLARAAHLSKDNTGVLRLAQQEQKSNVDKANLILIFSMNTNCESMAWQSF